MHPYFLNTHVGRPEPTCVSFIKSEAKTSPLDTIWSIFQSKPATIPVTDIMGKKWIFPYKLLMIFHEFLIMILQPFIKLDRRR